MKYKVQMTYHRHYYVEIEAPSEDHARSIARYKYTPEDCTPDSYVEWEVDSVQAQEQTT